MSIWEEMYLYPILFFCIADTIRYLSLHDNKYLRYFPGHSKKYELEFIVEFLYVVYSIFRRTYLESELLTPLNESRWLSGREYLFKVQIK